MMQQAQELPLMKLQKNKSIVNEKKVVGYSIVGIFKGFDVISEF